MGSSGGGGTGKVDYPAHMKEFHYQGLSDDGADTVNTSMTDLLNIALLNNPYSGLSPYRGLDELGDMETEWLKVVQGAAALDSIDWEQAFDVVDAKVNAKLNNSSTINAQVAAFTTILDNEIQQKAYPAFEAGMRDINAVMSSAFVVGRALIESERVARIAQYDADLRHKAFLQKNEIIARGVTEYLEWYLRVFESKRQSGMLSVDVLKTKVISEREFNELDFKYATAEANWGFESFMYAGNFLASIGGGTYVPAAKGMSSGQSALSGILSGAGMGAQVGGGPGAVIGGIIGGIGGLLG